MGFKTNTKNNFLSEEEMSRYMAGNLSEDEKKVIEQKLRDPFYAEALEGFKAHPGALKNLNKHRKELKARNVKPTVFSFNVVSITGIAAAFIVAVFLFTNSRENEKPVLGESVKSVKKEQTKAILPEAEEKISSELQLESTDETDEETKQFYENLISNAEDGIDKAEDAGVLSLHDMEEVPVLAKPDSITVSSSETEALAQLKTNGKESSEIDYIYNLKILTYAGRENLALNKSKAEAKNIEAIYESEEAKKSKSKELLSKHISYRDFLSDVLYKFTKGSYRAALTGFSTILKNFPEDLNAWFYSGLCYYHLQNYEQAIEQFDFTANHANSVFREEALWYQALSYEKNENFDKLKPLLLKIISENGFYSGKAKEKLKKLE